MIETLTRNYADIAVLKMLESARKVESSNGLATRLQKQQLDVWKQMGLDSDDVFRLLNLNDGVDNIFSNPVYRIWTKYLDDFNANNPTKKTTVFDTLRSHFSDNVMSQLLIAAQKNPSTEKIASKIQAQQLKVWLDRKELPDRVFKLLQVDKGLDNLLTNPQLSVWFKYATNYKLENPFTTQATMIGTFTTHYGDKAVLKMLREAKKVPRTKKLATDLEAALINKLRLIRDSNKAT
ncbi:unnamed protein product [Phytophthora fragariaefolia]|uniref:Unnamed protein product n=1 Tax=Phytophthora fragariaefolia TaxID=1490495 RepID=A0A9W6Y5D4_9STRA|nr:unnamed protein product [Phytophthora fragariaefolia]